VGRPVVGPENLGFGFCLPVPSKILNFGRESVRTLLIVAAVVCLALAIFYFIPGPYHPFTFSGTPTGRHITHSVVFLGLAVLAGLGARFVSASKQG